MQNVYFDTCVYHQAGIDLLFEVIDGDNILFGSEMLGAVRGVDPTTGHYFDDTKRYVDALDLIDARARQRLFGQRPPGLPPPRRRSRGAGPIAVATFTRRRRLARLRPQSLDADLRTCPPGRSTPTATCSAPVDVFPFSPERKYTPCRRGQGGALRPARPPRLRSNVIVQATCHGSDNAAMVDALIDAEAERAAWRRSSRRRRRTNCASCTTPACAACASTTCGASSTPSPTSTTSGSSRRSRRSAGTSTSTSRPPTWRERWDFFTSLRDHRRRRPHGSPRRHHSPSTGPSSGCSFASCESTTTSGPRSRAPSG